MSLEKNISKMNASAREEVLTLRTMNITDKSASWREKEKTE